MANFKNQFATPAGSEVTFDLGGANGAVNTGKEITIIGLTCANKSAASTDVTIRIYVVNDPRRILALLTETLVVGPGGAPPQGTVQEFVYLLARVQIELVDRIAGDFGSVGSNDLLGIVAQVDDAQLADEDPREAILRWRVPKSVQLLG